MFNSEINRDSDDELEPVTLSQTHMSGTEEEYGTGEDNVDLQSRLTKRPSRPSKDATSNLDIR